MRTVSRLTLLDEASEVRAAPLTPAALKAVHPLWAKALAQLGPWDKCSDGFTCPAWQGPDTVICGECASSLDVAYDLCNRSKLSPWGAVLATSQNAGRGQLRREWSSPPGNIYAAWRWPKLTRRWDPLLPLVAGSVTCETLEAFGTPISIKWPNDLLHQGRKVGGILVEERGDYLLVGIGINVASAPKDSTIREIWSPKATCLSAIAPDISLLDLWSALVNRTRNCYTAVLSGDNPRPFLSNLEHRLAWIGRQVRIHGSGDDYTAVITGLSEDGGLTLSRNGRTETLYSGSLSPL